MENPFSRFAKGQLLLLLLLQGAQCFIIIHIIIIIFIHIIIIIIIHIIIIIISMHSDVQHCRGDGGTKRLTRS